MKNLRIVSILGLFIAGLLLLSSCGSVHLNFTEGDLAMLKESKSLNLEFDYSQMAVGKFATEKEYITSKVNEETGKGVDWLEEWNSNKPNHFHPNFEEKINKYLSDVGVSVHMNEKAKYTMIVRPTFLEIGWNAVLVSQRSAIIAEVSIVETKNRSKNLAAFKTEEILGVDSFDARSRIKIVYGELGAYVGKGIRTYMTEYP